MSERCDKCGTVFLVNDVIAKCVECKRSFHSACSRAGSSQNFTKGKHKSWKCDTCFEENASLSSVRSNEEMDIKKYMADLLQSLKKDINKSTDDKIKTVLESVNCLSAELKHLQTLTRRWKIAVTTYKNEQQIERGGSRYTPSAARHRAAFTLSQHRDHRASRNTRGRYIYYCLQKIAHAINEDFSIAHRLRLYSKKHVHPPIIAQLTAARRMRNLNASDIDSALNNSPVFINEHLTAHNKAILGRARRLQPEKKISFAGFFNGKILVKVAEGAETERVIGLADLDKFDK
ncbi:hypothetical protein J6590_094948 [Homalodisca vitripennis]|nr:hypothetical protein J6590_094948 [Homalodisca vitripennis]